MKIESNIPIPSSDKRGEKSLVLASLKAGNSIVITKKDAPNWRTAAWRNKIKIVTRKISSTKFRLWRIK